MGLVPLIVYFIYLLVKLNKTFQFLQQNRYNRGNKYFKYLNSHIKNTYLNIELLFLPVYIVCYMLNLDLAYTIAILYVFFVIYKLYSYKIEQKKIPLKYTKRILRLHITVILLYVAICFVSYYYLIDISALLVGILLWAFMYLNHYVVIIANYINVPVERLVGIYYKNKAKKKLKSLSNLKVIIFFPEDLELIKSILSRLILFSLKDRKIHKITIKIVDNSINNLFILSIPSIYPLIL